MLQGPEPLGVQPQLTRVVAQPNQDRNHPTFIERWGERTKLIPWILVVVASCSVMSTLKDYGVTWDEVFDFAAGRSYVEWLSSPALSTIDQYWSVNSEHPPLTKVLGGMTDRLFDEYLGWCKEYVAYRISLLAFIVPLTLTFFLFARAYLGVWPAVFVSIALMFHPRLFFHAHIGALDYAMTATWFVTAYAMRRSKEFFQVGHFRLARAGLMCADQDQWPLFVRNRGDDPPDRDA